MILCIETATLVCSVALCSKTEVIGLKENRDTRSHASLLTVFIGEILAEAGIKPADLEAVAVSKGPGSYTGLRIGVSAAKGIAFGADIPIIGIDTLLAMFYGIGPDSSAKNRLFCPMLDARRMEVYHAIYDSNGNVVKPISAEIIDENSFSDIPEDKELILFGDGMEKIMKVLKRKNVTFADYSISASHMLIPAYEAFGSRKFEDVAYFEPFYLKDFIATKPVKNIFVKSGKK
jgi:tRNA threonylcarbamoyladenosine biosynthesis protein TsaB